ncbi:MAG: hypothetical protein NUV90_00800 [Candidatus Parcubacteria bacterium]|nr:hypothetical protein [Candidatus Parcubacteria bacterium]
MALPLYLLIREPGDYHMFSNVASYPSGPIVAVIGWILGAILLYKQKY